MATRRKLTAEEKADATRLAQAWRRYKAAHPQATQEWMSTQCGWKTQGAFFQYVSGIIPLNLKAALKISQVLGLSIGELSPRLAALMPNALAEASPGYGDGGRRIPVFTARQAVSFESTSARAAASTVALDAPLADGCGGRTFALVVSGRAMHPEFREGDVVVVDPDMPPRPGEIVAALIEDEREVMIRKYRVRKTAARQRTASIELVALNEDFGSIIIEPGHSALLIGAVVEHRRRLRRD